MKLTLSAGLCALLFAGASLIGGYAQAASSVANAIASAVADPLRPESDRNRDAARKPAESLQFSGIKPGDAVADFNASAGYFTRLFADVVGSRGHVYAIEPVEIQQYIAKATAELQAYAAGHPNVTVSIATALESLRSEKTRSLLDFAELPRSA
jgi:predicted methyltransferase